MTKYITTTTTFRSLPHIASHGFGQRARGRVPCPQKWE